ncbi:cyclic AMP response element-binding protein B isoform X2 [Anopheles ziemanni]|uniref:cyclic AMP response element-binding protein B isoform X2 n=1 Tax=Anopheles coustani TaxID=139045 RepID=UPI002659582B|nr:cyclic AMP response element-binding protein B isoform X2 [Anopheles coustani]XP_058176554.1 cyclic AMP response element-binding protein B isoform X2 [Anopheles ziemanni]
MDSSMVEENGSSAIGDPLGGAGGGGGGTGPSAGGEATGGSAGRGPATGATQLNENSGTSSNGNGSGGAAVAAPTAGAAAGGGGGGGGGSGGTGSAVTALGALTGAAGTAHSEAVLVSAATAGAGPNIVQLIPASQTAGQAQSVIQQNQQSVIQTAAGNVPITRGVLLVCNKPNSVIHTTTGNLQTIHIKPEPHIGTGSSGIMTDTNSDDTLSDEEASPKKRRDLLTRRPSYRKILSDLGGAEIDIFPNTVMGGNVQLEDQSRKREMRLQKNREAARECRRKKKEYIKCLENRVAVLENQNKALIEELKSLKELYCQQKSD